MALIVQSSLWLKVEYLSLTCSEVFADFRSSFRAQTMPITRSKQLVPYLSWSCSEFLQTSKCGFGTQTMPITRSKQLVEPL